MGIDKRNRRLSAAENEAIQSFLDNPVWEVIDDSGNILERVQYDCTVETIHGMTGVTPALIKTYLRTNNLKPQKKTKQPPYLFYGHCPITGLSIAGMQGSNLNF